MYCPSGFYMTVSKYTDINNALGIDFIIMGDLSAQHISWGSIINNNKGLNLLEALNRSGALVLNTGPTTRNDKDRTPMAE